MFTTGKCPGCGEVPTSLKVQSLPVHGVTMNVYQGVTFLCPLCSTILGAGMDPIALMQDTADATAKRLSGRR